MNSKTSPRNVRSIHTSVALALLFAAAFGVLFCTGNIGEQAGPGARGLAAIQVPPGFEVELAVSSDLVSYPMLGTLDDRGRLFFAESSGSTVRTPEMAANPDYIIRMVEDVDGDGIYDRSTVFADKLTMPNGAVWHQGSLYVSTPPDLLRFEDTDNDGKADVKQVLLTGWVLSANAASMHGPFLGPDGWLYITDGRHGFNIKTKEGTVFEGKAARIWRCRLDGSDLEWIAGGGMDNPVEIAFTDAGETFGTMTYFQDPANGQRDAILHYVEGGVYPKPHPVVEEFPRTGELMPVMTKFARIAPSGLMRYRSAAFGADFIDNLFTAQFNPHRVQRHILIREGATFRTVDSDFLTSSDPDFHPTDVMEDADGSLLVVDTGGWFIHGCPVSRIARPDIKGAVYRIRRTGAPRVNDPRGLQLGMEQRPARELAKLLEDDRWAVRDRALTLLVEMGESSVDVLKKVRERSSTALTRVAAVFGLVRIRSERALAAVREALDDDDFLVRVAAARGVGLERDRRAAGRLMEMLGDQDAPVRRQAATALGRIGDTRASGALLEASGEADERIIDHAITYALMQLKSIPLLQAALGHANARVRKTALIALDQMEGNPLRRRDAVAFIGAADAELRQAALWVASHHPAWSSDVLGFLDRQFRAASLSPSEMRSAREALLNYCAQEEAQELIARLLVDEGTTEDRRLALLETMSACSIDSFPSSWLQALRQQLMSGGEVVKIQVMSIVRSRDITALDAQLRLIAEAKTMTAGVRVGALGILVKHQPTLSDGIVSYLRSLLTPEHDADLRLSAARVLANTRLSDDALVSLAKNEMRSADALILQSLLDAFARTREARVGEALVGALLASPLVLGDAGSARLEEILQGLPSSVGASAEPLLTRIREARSERVERLKSLEVQLARGGDADKGRQVFFGNRAACSTCHTIGMEGGDVGPDLTAVGAVRSVHDLIEAIIFPSASFVPGHENYRVETEEEIYSGVLRQRNSEFVVLVSGPNDLHRIPRSKIKSIEPSEVSLMPEGFDESLTSEELADLFAFLRSQTSREAARRSGG